MRQNLGLVNYCPSRELSIQQLRELVSVHRSNGANGVVVHVNGLDTKSDNLQGHEVWARLHVVNGKAVGSA